MYSSDRIELGPDGFPKGNIQTLGPHSDNVLASLIGIKAGWQGVFVLITL